jgi:hypothetical protein
MRRLLTGYAVSFNRHNKRSGHLFQNRYKSIVCEEEAYLLELVRYIHLNPLRACLVKNLEELDQYPWSGHAVLLGNKTFSGQETESVLERFGQKLGTARSMYRQFVSDGIKAGRRDELVGGGLKRSQGERSFNEYESFDARVLGNGDFVDCLRQDEQLRDKMKNGASLKQLVAAVAMVLGLEVDSVRKPSKSRLPALARGIICHLAIFEFGYLGSEVGKYLYLGSSGVCLAAKRGEKYLKAEMAVRKQITAAIEK